MSFVPFAYRAALWCGLLLTSTGCWNPTAEPTGRAADPAQDSLLTQLAHLDRTALRRAFAQLPHYTYRRTRQTAYYNTPDAPMGAQTQTVRFTGTPSARSAETTAETQDGHLPEGFAAAAAHEDTTALDTYMLPDEPTYLSPRGREGYRFTRLPDTTLYGRAVQRFDVTARPGEQHKLRHARLYVEPTAQALIGLDVERVDTSLLFGEQSRFRLWLQPGPDTTWLPAHVEVDTRIKALFSAPKRFQTTTTYMFD